MHRFFVTPETLQADPVCLRGDQARQIARVLRLSPGDEILLLDNTGSSYLLRLAAVAPREVQGSIVERYEANTEPTVQLILYQAVPRAKKIEWVLQKGTEIGVGAFVPVIAERCQGVRPEDLDDSKLERWRRIVAEAAEQSGRAILPEVRGALSLAEALQIAVQADLALMAAVEEQPGSLRAALETYGRPPTSVALLVGPEGGFAPEEVALARAAGVFPVSLGTRVLRTETAALVAFSAILYALGELG